MFRKTRPRVGWLGVGTFGIAILQMAGCSHGGSGSGSGGGGNGPAPDTSLIGNWQFEASSSSTVPFTNLSGFVNEQGFAGGSTTTTASLQVQSTSCFANTKVIDLEGFTKAPLAQLTSFPADSQVVTLGLSQQCTNGVSLCGTYTVAGGCADKASGTIVGVKYAELTGTFSTSPGATPGVQITVSQATQGTGQGDFQVTGTMAFTGLSCATAATIDTAQSSLSGAAVHLVSQLSPAGSSPLIIDASLNTTATTLTLQNVTFTGGSCFQSLNGVSLAHT